jgi:flagellar hook-associated protein 1 FlgK
MNLDSALRIAASGLKATSQSLNLVSRNISGAQTPGYTAKTLPIHHQVAGGVSSGVVAGVERRSVDAKLAEQVRRYGSESAYHEVRADVLGRIDALNGKPEDATSIAGALSALTTAFTDLAARPSSSTQQAAVVGAARDLASGIQALSSGLTHERENVDAMIRQSVEAINSSFAEIGEVSGLIQQERIAGRSTADLEDRLDVAMQALSEQVDVSYLKRGDGSIAVYSADGFVLHDTGQEKLSMAETSLAPEIYYGSPLGTLPGIMLERSALPQFSSGPPPVSDVTFHLSGGRIGALLELRDQTIPREQAELDEFAQKLARRFDQQGLRLFSDAAGNVPDESAPMDPRIPVDPVTLTHPATYAGFASRIQVFAAVETYPSLTRDGTHPLGGTPSAPGLTPNPSIPAVGQAPFTPNPVDGPEGFTALAQRIITYTLGREVSTGVLHDTEFAPGSLGPGGQLSSALPVKATLFEYASALVSSQSLEVSRSTSQRDQAQGIRDAFETRLQSESGVDMDSEMMMMIKLQQSYSATAQLITITRQMYQDLFDAY